jgi:RNA polymerase sigma-70 factor (ECF subfamily)
MNSTARSRTRQPAQALDPAALTDLYLALNRRLYAYAYRLLGEADEAEDVVSEAFRRLLSALSRGYGPTEHAAAYLYRAVHNLAADRWRRAGPSLMPLKDTLAAGGDSDPGDSDPADGPADAAAARQALWRLTPDQRQVVLLKFFDGLDNAAIAAVLNKPVGAVKSLQHRALEGLRRLAAAQVLEGEGFP